MPLLESIKFNATKYEIAFICFLALKVEMGVIIYLSQ